MRVEGHFVTFFSPGTIVAETTTKPVLAWDVEEVMAMARQTIQRHNARPYAFQFSTRSREDDELDSKEVARSPLYYLGGKVETLAQVKARATDKDRILVSNMECNKWDRIITNDNSWRWVQPLNDTDIVLDFKM